MPAAKQIEPDTINKSLETDIEKNVYEVNRASDEMAANTIATLLRRVCKASTCEIDNLIGELLQKRRRVDSESGTALSLRTVITLDDKEIELGLAIA